MADEKVLRQARNVFRTVCQTLDDRNWTYEKDEENLVVKCKVNGDDIPIFIKIIINVDLEIVSLYSHLPIEIPSKEIVPVAVAISAANLNMVNGNFDLNISNGNLLYRMASSFKESLLSKDMFEYMIDIACMTVDHYNDKIKMVVDHTMSLDDFINFTKE